MLEFLIILWVALVIVMAAVVLIGNIAVHRDAKAHDRALQRSKTIYDSSGTVIFSQTEPIEPVSTVEEGQFSPIKAEQERIAAQSQDKVDDDDTAHMLEAEYQRIVTEEKE